MRPCHPQRHAVGKMDGGVSLFVLIRRIESPHRRTLIEELLQPAFALVFRVLIRLVKPQGRTWLVGDDIAQGDFRRGGLAALYGGYNAHQTHAGVGDGFHDIAYHGGVFNAESSRHGAVGNGSYMLLRPLPDGSPVRRSPCFTPYLLKPSVHGCNG